MSTTYSVPAARTAILAIARAALPAPSDTDPGVDVQRGSFGDYIAAETFRVGQASEGDNLPANIGQPRRFDEAFQLACQIRTWAGDGDEPAREDRAWALFELFAAPINADPTLSGLVLDCFIGPWELLSGATQEGGSAAEITFAVVVKNQTV